MKCLYGANSPNMSNDSSCFFRHKSITANAKTPRTKNCNLSLIIIDVELMDSFLVVVILLFVVGIFCFLPLFRLCKTMDGELPKSAVIEKYNNGKFTVYNYLMKPIRIKIGSPTESEHSVDIQPRRNKKIDIDIASKFLRKNSLLYIFIIDNDTEKFYCDYKINTADGLMIKNLHVGMITSRWVGANQDSVYRPGANGPQGRPWVHIANRTKRKIRLNYDLQVDPLKMEIYKGENHFGVPLGTVFKDFDGLYPDFKFMIPATHIYYGVVSDLQQSNFGGWQIDEELSEERIEPHFLLENGWMGGPANTKINPNAPEYDEWGVK